MAPIRESAPWNQWDQLFSLCLAPTFLLDWGSRTLVDFSEHPHILPTLLLA